MIDSVCLYNGIAILRYKLLSLLDGFLALFIQIWVVLSFHRQEINGNYSISYDISA
jgi:hypothetical protein